ncbi:MAG: formimidoylglutamase [Rhodospirillales bacterium]|nr:formimidoylglutamase [Rhodospirillales bacterium]
MPHSFQHILGPEIVQRSSREDKYETRINNWLRPWDGTERIDVGFLAIPFSKAHQRGHSGASDAPNAVRRSFLINTTYSPDFDVDVKPLVARDLGDVKTGMGDVRQHHAVFEAAIVEIYQTLGDVMLVIVGGDHSITCPLVQGYSRSHPKEKIGIVHFDAHNDVRHYEDGQPTRGTSFRGIIEGPANVTGANLVQVGIHGFMNSHYYRQYCREQGITVITARDIRRRGIQDVMTQAIDIAGNGTDSIYVSLDIDCLALPFTLGTAAATPEGMEAWDLLEALFTLGQHPKVRALDLVCIDPLRDFREYTARMGGSSILTFLGGYVIRKTGGRGY